ncbi:D-isomer specific 2-hydroxyacid dehydrogenase [Lipomyces arxii]|uniref:D-isomer specific 2-hydroxyacid dehydrogenase n=1 Tax=Lipomyces arxii TaxID=56418 RepID=UPI0034CD8527
MKIAILDDYTSVALSSADWTPLSAHEITVFTTHIADESTLVSALEQFDIICLMRERTPFPRSLFARLKNLKLLVTTGLRNLSIDLAAASEFNVVVSGTSSGGNSTVEHTWALILALARNIPASVSSLHQDHTSWQSGRLPTGLSGKTLGLYGLGNLGSKIARIATAFGMQVIAHSPNLTQAQCDIVNATLVTKQDLLAKSDFLSIHVVLSPRSVNAITAVDIATMKPSAFLINTSRGPIVNEQDLVTALENNIIAGAALDVFSTEPIPHDSNLRSLPTHKLILTPHIGYVSDESYAVFYSHTVDNIVNFIAHSPVRVLNS